MSELVRVLFVDDEEPMLRSIERVTRGQGLEVFLEREPLRALDVLRDRRIEILVTDYAMPGMTGLSLLAEAKRRHPSIVRVLMSASADRVAALDAIEVGEFAHFLEKPWPPGELRQMLVELSQKVVQARAVAEAADTDPLEPLKSPKK